MLLLCAAPPAGAATIVVTPGGDDRNPGTYALPKASIQKALDLARPGDTVLLRKGVYPISQALRINGKVGTVSQKISLVGETGATLRTIGEGVPGVWRGIIEVDNADWVQVANLAVEDSSFFGLRIQQSRNITVSNVRSTRSLGSGIYANTVANLTASGNDVSRFCDRNAYGGGAGCQEGISLSAVDGFKLWGNKVHNAPQAAGVQPGGGEGIDIKSGSRNGIVAYNRVWNLVQIGIYLDGWAQGISNVAVYGNEVWNTHMGIVVSSERGGLVKDVSIHHNTLHDVGYDGILVSNFANPAGADGWRENISIYNNTIVNSGVKEAKPPYCVLWSNGPCPDYGTGINVGTLKVKGLNLFDNIVVGSKTAHLQLPAALRTTSRVQTNLFWPPISGGPADSHDGSGAVLADPLFANPASFDYRLMPNSPAIGAGTGRTGSVAPLPAGSGPNIGALLPYAAP